MHRLPWLTAWAAIAVNTFAEMEIVKAKNAAQREEAARVNAEGRARVSARRRATA